MGCIARTAATATLLTLALTGTASAQFIQLGADAIRGRTIALDEGSTLAYRADGSYVYTLGTRQDHGRWRIGPNGAVCVDFRNGRGRCDFYLEQAGQLFLKNSRGNVFRVRFAQ